MVAEGVGDAEEQSATANLESFKQASARSWGHTGRISTIWLALQGGLT